jgi:hypothetical protein
VTPLHTHHPACAVYCPPPARPSTCLSSPVRLKLVSLFLATSLCTLAQNLSLGVLAGTNLTRGIEDVPTPIAGAIVEWKLPLNLSLEADGIWHSYPAGHQDGTEVTWEIPVLLKYRFRLPFGRPFIEGGPSLRTEESHAGVTAGAGIEFHVWRGLNIAPEVRYTHWDSNGTLSFDGLNPNQVEFLTAFTSIPDENWHPLGGHVSIGVVLGATLTPDVRTLRYTGGLGYNNLPLFTATSVSTPGPDSFLIGPSLEIQLPLNLSLEVDAIRRPIPEGGYWTAPPGTTLTATQSAALAALNAVPSGPPDITWDFPLLAKYKFRLPVAAPFAELGPSFRLPQEINGGNLSTHGVTAGLGVEARLLHLNVAPELRFTRGVPAVRFIPARPPSSSPTNLSS